jgi:hypothetical protein
VNNSHFSSPTLTNNILYQNRSFYFSADVQTSATVAAATHLYPAFTTTELAASDHTYACPSGATYWDLGLVNDTNQTTHQSGYKLNPTFSVLSSANVIGSGQYASSNRVGAAGLVTKQYCNGPRSNPGTPDAGTGPLVPLQQFTMQAAATEDEGGNWIDVRFGPISLSDSSAYTTAGTVIPALGDYHLATGSVAIDHGTSTGAPNRDIDGQSRPIGAAYDIGADEFGSGTVATGTVSITPNPLLISLPRGVLSNTALVTLTNNSTNSASVTISTVSVSGGAALDYLWNKVNGQDGCTGKTLLPTQTCTVGVRFTNVGATRNGTNRTGTITFTDNASGSPQSGTLNGQAR